MVIFVSFVEPLIVVIGSGQKHYLFEKTKNQEFLYTSAYNSLLQSVPAPISIPIRAALLGISLPAYGALGCRGFEDLLLLGYKRI